MNENHWQALQQTQELVRFADTKSGAVLAAQIAIFAVAAPSTIENYDLLLTSPCSIWLIIACSLSALLSIGLALLVIIPRISVGEPKSLIFFSHIDKAYSSGEAFSSHAKPYYNDSEEFSNQILEQIWAVSKVAAKKHRLCAISLILFGIELAFLFALLIIATTL